MRKAPVLIPAPRAHARFPRTPVPGILGAHDGPWWRWRRCSSSSRRRHNVDGPATFEASFSNLFQGEIMRMDAVDIPLIFAGVRHNFASKRKLYVQLQGVEQLQAENMKEVDLEIGADFFRRIRVVAIGSYVYSRATKDRENLVAKMEVRLGF